MQLSVLPKSANVCMISNLEKKNKKHNKFHSLDVFLPIFLFEIIILDTSYNLHVNLNSKRLLKNIKCSR